MRAGGGVAPDVEKRRRDRPDWLPPLRVRGGEVQRYLPAPCCSWCAAVPRGTTGRPAAACKMLVRAGWAAPPLHRATGEAARPARHAPIAAWRGSFRARCRHNEIDEPMFTQPLMYQAIKRHKNALNVRALGRRGAVLGLGGAPAVHAGPAPSACAAMPCGPNETRRMRRCPCLRYALHAASPQPGLSAACPVDCRCTRRSCCGRGLCPRSRWGPISCPTTAAASLCRGTRSAMALSMRPKRRGRRLHCTDSCSSTARPPACCVLGLRSAFSPLLRLPSLRELPLSRHARCCPRCPQVRAISDKVQKLLHDAFEGAKDYKPKKVGRWGGAAWQARRVLGLPHGCWVLAPAPALY